MTLGEKIKKARKEKGLTQKELAEMVGAKHNSVSDWENNKNKPDMDTIESLCGVLELTANYLMGTKNNSEYGDIVGRIMNDSICLDMIENYYSLNESDKAIVQRIVRALRESRGV